MLTIFRSINPIARTAKSLFKRSVIASVFALTLTACNKQTPLYLQSGSQPIENFKGTWLLINYWAEWCKPCIKEIPELNRLNERSDITILAYNFDNLDTEALTAAAAKLSLELPLLTREPSQALETQKPSVLPATYVIKPDGNHFGWLLGPQTQESILTKLSIP